MLQVVWWNSVASFCPASEKVEKRLIRVRSELMGQSIRF